MRYDACWKRGLPVGSGVVESARTRIVGSRFKQASRPLIESGRQRPARHQMLYRREPLDRLP